VSENSLVWLEKKLISYSLILLITGIYLVGCTGNNTIPLPSSAKHYSPNGISLDANQITIPFLTPINIQVVKKAGY